MSKQQDKQKKAVEKMVMRLVANTASIVIINKDKLNEELLKEIHNLFDIKK
jgi:hypothetical protein